MKIEHEVIEGKGRFFITKDEESVAKLVYSFDRDNKMIIEHTVVKEELRGGSLGYDLVQKAVAMARNKHYTIIPLCQFARTILEKNSKYSDVFSPSDC